MKAVAVPYIIAILLGVAVIGLVGYWFFTQGGKTTVTGTNAECDAKVASYCLSWKTSGNKPTINPDEWKDCNKKSTGIKDEDLCKSLGISIP